MDTDSPLGPLQDAVVYRLDHPPTGVSFTGITICDEVPAATVPPYIVIGEGLDNPSEARGVRGRYVTLTIRAYSRDAGGKAEVHSLISKVVQALTASALTITGWKEVQKRYQQGHPFRDNKEPGMTYSAQVIFMFILNRSAS